MLVFSRVDELSLDMEIKLNVHQ